MIWLQHHQCLKKKEGRWREWKMGIQVQHEEKGQEWSIHGWPFFFSFSLSKSVLHVLWMNNLCSWRRWWWKRKRWCSLFMEREDEKYKFYRFSLLLIICSRFSCCSSASALHARESSQRSDLRSFEEYELYWLNKEQYSPSSEAGDDAVAVSFPVFSLHFLCIMMMMMISWLSLSLSSSTEAGEGLSICEDIV